MAEIYLGNWEWINARGDAFWRAPGGDTIGSLDLRSLPECGTPGPTPNGFGLFVYAAPKAHANLALHLGSDLTRNLTATEKSAIRTFWNIPLSVPVVDKVGDAIRQWLLDLDYFDPTGQTRWKPLRGRRGQQLDCKLGGFGTLFRERFDTNHPAFAATVEVFKADYLREREVKLRDPVILRKWTGSTMQKLFGRMSDLDADSILPTKYRNDGWSDPATTISDDFNRADESLDAGPWVEIVGNWAITSNQARQLADTPFANCRHTSALSSDDMTAQVTATVYSSNPSGENCGPMARVSTDASPNHDNYHLELREEVPDLMFAKQVNGTRTILDTNQAITPSAPDDIKIECDDSAMKSYFNATLEHDFADTSLTGLTGVGMWLRRSDTRLDNFTASDIAAGGAFEIDAQPGGYSITGTQAGTLAARMIDGGPGSYVLTGIDAGLLADRIISANPGIYAITGSAAGVLAGRMINAEPGAYALTGVNADLVYVPTGPGAFEINAEPGSYAITGSDAGVLADRIMNAAPGVYLLTGADAAAVAGRIIAANPGSYAVTGEAAGVLAERLINAAQGVYTITGEPATLVFSGAPTIAVIVSVAGEIVRIVAKEGESVLKI